MNTTMLEIDVLQTRLNALMGRTHHAEEVYALSQELDLLILAYYREKQS